MTNHPQINGRGRSHRAVARASCVARHLFPERSPLQMQAASSNPSRAVETCQRGERPLTFVPGPIVLVDDAARSSRPLNRTPLLGDCQVPRWLEAGDAAHKARPQHRLEMGRIHRILARTARNPAKSPGFPLNCETDRRSGPLAGHAGRCVRGACLPDASGVWRGRRGSGALGRPTGDATNSGRSVAAPQHLGRSRGTQGTPPSSNRPGGAGFVGAV